VSGGVGPSKPSSVSAIAAASARSAWSVQETGPSSGAATSPVLEAPGPVGAAVALRAVLDGVAALTAGERAVMREWLDRVAAG
jgi:hypothetical protein